MLQRLYSNATAFGLADVLQSSPVGPFKIWTGILRAMPLNARCFYLHLAAVPIRSCNRSAHGTKKRRSRQLSPAHIQPVPGKDQGPKARSDLGPIYCNWNGL